MYKVAFEKSAEKEFLKLDRQARERIVSKIIDLKNGHFANDKALKGKHQGKFRKRARVYRIVYLKENDILLITIIRVAAEKKSIKT